MPAKINWEGRESQTCTKCAQHKPISEFRPRKMAGGVGRYAECRDCTRARRREKRKDPQYRAKERAKNKERDSKVSVELRRSRRYKVPLAKIIKLHTEQGNCCAICGLKQSSSDLHLDHCHSTGKVRGLLCWRCNTGLGFFHDIPLLLIHASAYLVKHAKPNPTDVPDSAHNGSDRLGHSSSRDKQ